MDSADSVLENCKRKVKLLMEFSTTCKHIHWSHSSVFDFCVSVENVLSLGGKKEMKRFGRKDLDQLFSLRILASLSQTDPLCEEVFRHCYPSLTKQSSKNSTAPVSRQKRKEYLKHSGSSLLEYSILWIRACLVEKKLSEAVKAFIKNAHLYYSSQSVINNEVNADIFSFLLSKWLPQLAVVSLDGIAIVTIVFQHHSSVMNFLECLENGLLPKGCLQPPLFYLQNHRHRSRKKNKSDSDLSSTAATHPLCSASPEPLQMVSHNSHSLVEVAKSSDQNNCHIWDQVFAVRYGSRQVARKSLSPLPAEGKKTSLLMGEIPGLAVIMPTPDQCTAPIRLTNDVHAGRTETGTETGSDQSDSKRNKAFQDLLAKKQQALSVSLLASYFYSWLSYCRHRSHLRKNISHLLLTNPPFEMEESSNTLTDATLQLLIDEEGRITDWGIVLNCVYYGGVEDMLRTKVWPVLLGVYPYDASSSEREVIRQQSKIKYEQLLREGRQIEDSAKVDVEERRLAESQLFNEMMAKMKNNSPDKQTSNSNSNKRDESEVKKDSKSHRYMQELEIIDKDVNRCDRNYEYFKTVENLSKLRNIIACYCLENLKEKGIFYAQGMTDLLAPLLVIFDDEVITYSCFVKMMDRLIANFPPNEGMHQKFTNMRNLTEVLEPEFVQQMQQPDFLFCSRWFLLAFKREFSYKDIFRLWETMWAAEGLVTKCFMEFFALSLLRQYIPTIMHKKMDTFEILNLFGEMESRQHNGEFELILSRTLSLITNVRQKFIK